MTETESAQVRDLACSVKLPMIPRGFDMKLSGEQYDALVLLMRGDSQSKRNRAARSVLVDGITQAEAVVETGASRSTVSDGVKCYADAARLMQRAFSTVTA